MDKNDWVSDLVGALMDPIIVFDPGWADVLPAWLKAEINMQRLAQLVKGEEEIATDAEALAYISNASLAQPIPSDWVEIYQYLLTRVMGSKVPEEMRKAEEINIRGQTKSRKNGSARQPSSSDDLDGRLVLPTCLIIQSR